MIPIRRLILLLLLLSGVGSAVAILAFPEMAAQGRRMAYPIVRDINLFVFGLAVALVFVLLALARLFRGTRTDSSRPVIVDEPPETVTTSLPQSTDDRQQQLKAAIRTMQRPSRNDRLVAMYGRRATVVSRPSSPVQAVLDELTDAAEQSYMTAHGVDRETAADAVAEGRWCESAEAQAFLAAEPDPPAAFSITQRVIGWSFPRRVFRRRVDQTVGAIESLTDTYGLVDTRQLTEQRTSSRRRSTHRVEEHQ